MELFSPHKRPRSGSGQIFLIVLIAGLIVLFSIPYFLSQRSKENVKAEQTVSTQTASYENILVAKVVDGDTIALSTGERVRLIGIDTPESSKNKKAYQDSKRTNTDIEKIISLGKKAKAYVAELVEGRRVRLEFDVSRFDKYGRLLAYVYLEDGTFLNRSIIEAGYASPMSIPPNVKFADHFQALYKQARTQKRGLWQSESLAQN